MNKEIMTFEKLSKLIDKYNIPKNVHLLSDSGWEGWATEMCGVYYNKKENIIVFTQEISKYESYDKRNKHHIKGFIALRSEDKPEYLGYSDKECINCGRLRVEKYSDGTEICEKCNFDQNKKEYVLRGEDNE